MGFSPVAGRTLINPPLGIKTVGFTSREGVVEQIESDLTSTAIVFAAGDARIAILALDLCNPSIDMVADWRRQVADAIGTTPAHVMINLSHTHSGPPQPGRRTGILLPGRPDRRLLRTARAAYRGVRGPGQ